MTKQAKYGIAPNDLNDIDETRDVDDATKEASQCACKRDDHLECACGRIFCGGKCDCHKS